MEKKYDVSDSSSSEGEILRAEAFLDSSWFLRQAVFLDRSVFLDIAPVAFLDNSAACSCEFCNLNFKHTFLK